MQKLVRAVITVLWSLAGLAGGQSNAEQRTRGIGILPLVATALVVVLLLVLALVLLARYAAST